MTTENAERTLASIARMLGWMNVPPRETLERQIAEMNRRLQNVTIERGWSGSCPTCGTYVKEAEPEL